MSSPVASTNSVAAAGPAPGRTRYTSVAIALHWTIGLGIVAMLAMGLVMTHVKLAPFTQFKLYQLHKSVGITILVAAALRLLWRFAHPPPALPDDMPRWEKGAAEATHVLLYGLMIGMPLVGWALVSAAPLNIPTVLYGVIPWPHIPIFADLHIKAQSAPVLARIHAYGGYTLIALLALHAGAALRHHLVLRDDVLRRMIPGLPWFGRAQTRTLS